MPKYSRRQLARGYATLLITHKMTRQVDQLMADIAQELLLQRRHLTVTVTTAHKLPRFLTASLAEKLRASLAATTVSTISRHDPAILGGFIAHTPKGEFDASIRYKLNRLKTTS